MMSSASHYQEQPPQMQPEAQQILSPDGTPLAYVKLVFSNLTTSVVIGKNGENVHSLRQNNGVRVRISPSDGASDRYCIISGPIHGVKSSLHHICDLLSQVTPNPNSSATVPIQMQISIPETSVSAVIGRKGARVSEIRHNTGARVKICDRGQGVTPPDRLIMISADSPSQAAEASAEVVDIIQSDPSLMQSMKFQSEMQMQVGPYSPDPSASYYQQMGNPRYFQQSPGGPARPPSGPQAQASAGGAYSMYPGSSPYFLDYAAHAFLEPQHMEKAVEIIMPISDNLVGQLLGKAGKNITDIKKYTGANITISSQDNVIPDTDKRLCTIAGSIMSVHLAHARIVRKLAEIETQKQFFEGEK